MASRTAASGAARKREAIGMQPGVTVLARERRSGRDVEPWTRKPVAQLGRVGTHRVDRREVERRDDDRRDALFAHQVDGRDAPRSCSGSASASHGETLHLDVHEAVPRTRRAPRRASASTGTAARISANGRSASRPSPSARASWWTTSTPSAVRRTSSSTPSAPSSRARDEGVDGVLGRTAGTPRDGRERAVATTRRPGYADANNATCSTFGRKCPGQALAWRATAVTLPNLAAGIRATETGHACDRAHKTGRT